MKKAFINWSSGKDAAFALYLLQQHKEYSPDKLLSSFSSDTGRVSMHGVKKELLLQQAAQLNLPLQLVSLPEKAPMDLYDEIMGREIRTLVSEGFTHSVFGDILLEDLRRYRENQLSGTGLKAVFPLWKKDTAVLVRDFIDAGFKAITVSVNSRLMDSSFCGKLLDHDFLQRLPAEVDPCGENGEFHTFVYDGPNFKKPVRFRKGEMHSKSFKPVKKKGEAGNRSKDSGWDTEFLYCDLLPE